MEASLFHRGRLLNRSVSAMCLAWTAATFACSIQDYDYLQDHASGGSHTGSGGRAARGGSSNGGATSGGSSGAGGSTSGATGSGGSTPQPGEPLGPWEFNSLAEAHQWPPSGVDIPPDAVASWKAEGEREPLGAMVLSTSVTALFQIGVLPANANQAHHRIVFRTRAESGTHKVKPFVMSTGWKWSDGGEFTVGTEWSDAVVDLDNPSYEGAGYDATSLINVGIGLICASTQEAPCVVWIDRAWVEPIE
ncbi:MAG: hypothetical protein ACOY0T_27790 [Myxococcota bacterium]